MIFHRYLMTSKIRNIWVKIFWNKNTEIFQTVHCDDFLWTQLEYSCKGEWTLENLSCNNMKNFSSCLFYFSNYIYVCSICCPYTFYM